jgi:hypothetical protein
MTTPQIMGRYARANNCNHSPYNQMTDLGIDRGICYGLAVCWLKSVCDGERENFFRDVRVNNSDMHRRAHGYWETQRETNWQQETGFYQAQGKTVSKKFHAKDEEGFEEDNMVALANWFSAARGTRYFLLHVGGQTTGHTMAATGSRLGKLRFFDPNGGVADTVFANRLGSFMNAYFNDDRIKEHYKSPAGYVQVNAEKFKHN